MIKRFSLILFFLMICLCFSVFSSEVLFSENFPYINNFASHGWSYSNGACGASSEYSIPIPSFFDSGAFGMNQTSGCGFDYLKSISRTLPINITSDILEIDYSVYLSNDSTVSNLFAGAPIQIHISNSSSGAPYIAFHYTNKSFNVSVSSSIFPNFVSCSKNIAETSLDLMPYSHAEDRIILDYSNKRYTWIMNDVIICDNVKFGNPEENIMARSISFLNAVGNLETMIGQIDNILITADISVINTSLELDGYPCTINEDCQSGKCEYGACVLKQKGETCIDGAQCASGVCYNGLCTMPSLSQNFNRMVKENFGDDTSTKNMISLFFMIAIPSIVMIMSGGSALGVVFGMCMFISLGFLFAVIGMLSAFILIGAIIAVIAGAIAVVIIKGGGQ